MSTTPSKKRAAPPLTATNEHNETIPHRKKLRSSGGTDALFFAALKAIPGELRNQIYDEIVKHLLPDVDEATVALHTTLYSRRACRENYGIEMSPESPVDALSNSNSQRALASGIRNCVLRFVPGLRDEFMSRLWRWRTLDVVFRSFIPKDTGCVPRNFSFLYFVNKLTYNIDPNDLPYTYFHKSDAFDLLKPFIQALEDMQFNGTLRLRGEGRALDTELAFHCINRTQKYWRLGYNLDTACEFTRIGDHAWRIMNECCELPQTKCSSTPTNKEHT